jgi:hypothetical protein
LLGEPAEDEHVVGAQLKVVAQSGEQGLVTLSVVLVIAGGGVVGRVYRQWFAIQRFQPWQPGVWCGWDDHYAASRSGSSRVGAWWWPAVT